jgi:hypothetical protein
MLIQDTIGCFAQIERREEAILAALESQEPIWFLVLKSDEINAEVTTLTTVGWTRFVRILQAIHKLQEDSLLTILHSSRLFSDDSSGLVRLRDWSHLYRDLSPRLEELDTIQLVVMPPTRGECVISVRKHGLQPSGPLSDRVLRVSAKPVGSSAGTVAGSESEDTGWVDDFAIDELIGPLSRAIVKRHRVRDMWW